MKKFMVLLMTTVFCLQGSAFGEDAKDIMKKIREKDQNIGKVFKTFRMSYEKKAPWGFNGTFETLIKGEKKRSNNKSGTLTSDVVFDGKTYWSLLAFGGMTTKQNSKYYDDNDKGIFGWCKRFNDDNVKLTGEETVADRKCYIIEGDGGEEYLKKIWVDKKTLSLVKSSGGNMKLVNSDFKVINDDYELPMKTEIFKEDKIDMTIAVTVLEIDKEISDSVFKVEAKDENNPFEGLFK
ncbi:MAG: hypothetical protein A2452_05265 [Candidatus Firestonebacteria bacterium RIFOXYC2_FULL_39_67]|nr:MAG: hypothetical protein A2536_11005 [Candidatus Firestonebacteria bacterium RIFOXYD2_FULL_39_29]OGF54435.1 MAG: hypothetical protein A2452_05265 [Candidatus Firestonebacteria bacterium RIFOXYC2_FULL_39_67]